MRPPENVTRRTVIAGSAAVAALGIGAAPAHALIPSRRAEFAIPQLITGRSTVPMNPNRVVMHIAAIRSDDFYGTEKGPDGSYAHFYNRRSGAPLQHQRLDRVAPAQIDGNTSSISVEHSGVQGDSMTDEQLTYLARIFAWSHVYCGVPNRIATVRPDPDGVGYRVNLRGLAWHRLGVGGDWGPYNPNDRKTWSRTQTGKVWSSSIKECPTDNFIDQIPDVFRIAQIWIQLYQRQAQA